MVTKVTPLLKSLRTPLFYGIHNPRLNILYFGGAGICRGVLCVRVGGGGYL